MNGSSQKKLYKNANYIRDKIFTIGLWVITASGLNPYFWITDLYFI